MKKIFKAMTLLVLSALLFSACAPATVPGESDVSLTSKDDVAALTSSVTSTPLVQRHEVPKESSIPATV